MKLTLALLTSNLFPPLVQSAINWDVFEYGVVPGFRWSRPFPDDGTDPGGFHVNCRASGTFHARMYKLKDLPEAPPAGLAPWHEAIEDFLGRREYVGSWDGVDHKASEREIVVMEWADVPVPVREWIEERQRDEREGNEDRWLFGVFEKPSEEGAKVRGTVKPRPPAGAATATDTAMASSMPEQGAGQQLHPETEQVPEVADQDKIVVFPAGGVYEILPLWVSKGSSCERDLSNLAKYRPQAVDHSVLAWVVDHTKPHRDLGKRDMTFRIEAMSVTETEDGKRARLMWEKLHRTIKRNERRMQREERQKARKEMEQGKVRDEL